MSTAAPASTASAPALSACAALVRRHDPDRFLTALFAPPTRREVLFTLYAFNHELARAREVASEPTLALIRLQWWREVVQGVPKRHEVATPLSGAIAQGLLLPDDLLGMIDGREVEADGEMATLRDWHGYLAATAGGVAVAAGRALGASGEVVERLRRLGAAYGVAGQLRSVPVLARAGRCQLPGDVLAAHGLDAHTVTAGREPDRLRAALSQLAGEGRALLAGARGSLPGMVVAAALPAVLARRDLSRPLDTPPGRGLGDRLAVLMAALRRSV